LKTKKDEVNYLPALIFKSICRISPHPFIMLQEPDRIIDLLN